MLTVKATVAPDRHHGKGVYAETSISKDTVVWHRNETAIQVYSFNEYKSILAQGGKKADILKRFSYPCEVTVGGQNMRALCRDSGIGSYINHNDAPNLGLSADKETLVALRHIRPGDELTRDYREFVPDLSQWTDIEHCASFLLKDEDGTAVAA